jgi:excisionase family DNA binding protein
MRTPTPQPKPVSYSVEDAARALGIGRSLAFRLIREGQLAAVKIGRRTVVPVKECEAFLARLGGAA